MSRPLSTAALEALFRQETDEAIFFLITIDHPDFTNPIRLVNNTTDIVSNGDTYNAFPFEITLPIDDPERESYSMIKIENVSLEINALLRPLASSPTVELSVIFSSSPDTIEIGPFNFLLRDYRYNAQSIEGTLAYEDTLNETLPAHTFNPNEFPGLF